MELVDEADLVAPDGCAFVVAQIVAGLAGDEDFATVWMFQQTGKMQQGRFTGAGRCNQGNGLSASKLEVSPLEDRKRGLALAVNTFDARELQDGFTCQGCGSYSYRRAWTGSSFEARHAGKIVAMKESANAMITTDRVSLKLISAGSWLKK